MRLLSISIALWLLLPSTLRAQTAVSSGSCTGAVTGTVGLSYPDPTTGNLTSISPAAAASVFGLAECQCMTMDINMEIFLTQALPQGAAQASAELWVGPASCATASNRFLPGSLCQKLPYTKGDLFSQFKAGSQSGANLIEIPLSASAITSPNSGMCTSNASNLAFVFIFTDPNMPLATCTLQPQNEQVTVPAAPGSPSASSGDGAVNLSWNSPSVLSPQPSFFQILCADANGNPVFSSHSPQVYSTCLPGGVIKRRTLPTGGGVGTTVPDGGTTTTDGGVTGMALRSAELVPNAVTDAGVGGPFNNLDPRFICTNQLQPNGSTSTPNTVRISGLANGQTYQFVVLSVDNFGNATPSGVITAMPQPAEDLYRRYYDAGGRASGFCFIATAAFGSYESRYVYVLRNFRDQVLLPTHVGARFVDWYYRHSPPAAALIARHAVARFVVRLLLLPVIGFAAAWLYLGPAATLLGLLGIVALFLRPRFRREHA